MTAKDPSSFTILSSSIDYELLDSGNRRKLERFGSMILDRPEVEADWKPQLSKEKWNAANWHFYEEKGKTGVWTLKNSASESWSITYNCKALSLSFDLKLTAFKHIGIFPEQAENWDYIQQQLYRIKGDKKVLNLFAYTGAASVVAAACGAKVTNVDSVRQVLNWGKQHAIKNNIDSIRWILEDARKFVSKALRRGEKYHGIIMDPPAFGYGTKNEKWKLERDLKSLLEQSIQLLHPEQNFFILNTYSPQLKQKKLDALVKTVKQFPKQFELTTLALKTSKGQLLPLGNLLRFSK